jgi:hypothetical protein
MEPRKIITRGDTFADLFQKEIHGVMTAMLRPTQGLLQLRHGKATLYADKLQTKHYKKARSPKRSDYTIAIVITSSSATKTHLPGGLLPVPWELMKSCKCLLKIEHAI